ncbi:MAG: hypothetical protein J6A37_05475 [Oscillospiraceae bacterium]|nr:hypothetical protein [Oscillospiraceae bacterium]
MSEHKKAEVNVLMLGARRAGKTSILASMCEIFDNIQAVSGASLSLNQDLQNDTNIDSALGSMKKIFYNHQNQAVFDTVNDVQTTEGRRDYTFNLRVLKNKKSKHSIRFTDLPGEYIAPPDNCTAEEKARREATVRTVYDESDIIFVAIDTVFLMEKYGLYNEQNNECSKITRWLKDINPENNARKMVLFVPIKFETYYYSGRASEVNRQIHIAYDQLINFLTRDDHKDSFFVAITPVLTLGDVIFERFNDSSNGNPIALYKFRSGLAKYNPQFCEQPMLYVLSYLYQLIKYKNSGKEKKFKLWWDKFLNSVFSIKNDRVFLLEIEKAMKARKTDAPFEIIQDSFKK